MWRNQLSAKRTASAAAVLAAVVASVQPAAAIDAGPSAGVPILTPGDLQIQLNAARRDVFQADQQRLRQIDRDIINAPAPRPEVPVMSRNCRMEAVGTRIVRICR